MSFKIQKKTQKILHFIGKIKFYANYFLKSHLHPKPKNEGYTAAKLTHPKAYSWEYRKQSCLLLYAGLNLRMYLSALNFHLTTASGFFVSIILIFSTYGCPHHVYGLYLTHALGHIRLTESMTDAIK